jgi:Mg-chelatase subunit ChlD
VSRSRRSRHAVRLLALGLALAGAFAGAMVAGAGPVAGQGASGSPPPAPLASLPGLAPGCTPEVEPDDQPEQAAVMSGPICLTGTLPALRDQDLVLWDVTPIDALSTWRVTVVGIPTTYTSVHVFTVRSAPGVFPVDAAAIDRIDSDASSDTPGVRTGYVLPAGRYLLGISRGDPAAGPPAPPGQYRISFEREQALPASADREPNDDPATATPVAAPVDLTGVVEGGPDLYRWTIDAAAAARRQRIDLRVVPGDALDIRLRDAAGTELARASTGRDGLGHIHDLALGEGDYHIEVSTGSGGAHGYQLATVVDDDPLADGEPNYVAERALPIGIGETLSGRLAGDRDIDRYAFEVPQTLVASQWDIALDVGSGHDRRLCLVGPDQREIQCRQGTGDLDLSNLALVGGAHRIVIEGQEDLDDHYRLSLREIGPRSPEREVEPNDSPGMASIFDPRVTMHGRSANGDPDQYLVTTTGEPQLWRLEATGSAIRSLRWLEPDGEVLGTGDIAADGSRASLWDMYLIPGRHWIAVQAEGEDYTLTMTPLGPIAEGQEREPNEDIDHAEPIELGATRVGRLPSAQDTDVVRFGLQARQHVRIHLDPPADAGIRLRLTSGGTELRRVREPVTGEPFVYDAVLELGDYELTLQADTPSIEAYQLRVDRADPWSLPTDLEPNDLPELARDVPPTLELTGTGFGRGREDTDWFRIPVVPDASQPLVVTTSGAVDALQLLANGGVLYMDPDTSHTTWTSRALPEGISTLLMRVAAGGDYGLRLSGAGLVPTAPPGASPVTVALTTTTPRVAAYATVGQTVDAMLAITNDSAEDLELTPRSAITDDRWMVELDGDPVSVPGGATSQVPVRVTVPPDAWADVPTRMSVAVTDESGRAASAELDITPDRDLAPVAPAQAWPVPAALLGGLDAASLALGASIVSPTFAPASEELLHDGMAVMGSGFIGSIAGRPARFTVDLATDEPVPVAGVIIAPLAGVPVRIAAPRSFELELSEDGTTWRSVLTDELSLRMTDQPFALPAPIPARYARLSIASTWGGDHTQLQLGEWQVVAAPGWAPDGSIDVADPRFGGHVVSASAALTDPRQGQGMLSETIEPDAWQPYLEPRTPFSWVIGFRDGRAPQVTELQWFDVAGSDPARRFASVEVELSVDSPLGPWQPAGSWDLTLAEDGSVSPFRFGGPTWARYLRFTGAGPAETKEYREMPVVLRVLERPTDATYRSIIGAWGRASTAAIRELLLPPDLASLGARVSAADGDDHPLGATPLVEGVAHDAAIERGVDLDWYTLTVPAHDNTLQLALESPPSAGITLALSDITGREVPLREVRSSSPTIARYAADVEPGATYLVRVVQPPFSTVFTYDTSGSLGPVLGYVSGALRGFAADIRPGEGSVLIMPFEDTPLLPDWSDDRWLIEDAVAGVSDALGSSAAETSMISAAKELASRSGARTMLVVTDAETMSFHRTSELWDSLADVRPTIFTVHVGGGGAPAQTTGLMEDWANAWGGHYAYAASHAELDRAFDRLATWLRRPAAYRISYDASFIDHTPGQLSLEAPPGPDGPSSVVAGSGVGVEILLDTSGSMRARIGKQSRIAIAKRVLRTLVSTTLPEGLPVALRTFDPASRCGSRLVTPLGPLDRKRMLDTVSGVRIVRKTRTPIAATLQQVAGDLSGAQGTAIVVLVTDGAETCKGDPEAVIRDLVASGLDVRLNIVGFAIDDEDLRQQLAAWARLGGGEAFSADDADSLGRGIAAALAAPFRVLDATGAEVAHGVVGGDPVSLSPGSYTVEVLTEPVRTYSEVVIAPGGWRRIEVGDEGASTEGPAAPPGVSQ